MMAALLPGALAAQQPGPRAGDVYAITKVSETRWTGAHESNGHAYDRDAWIERVIAVRDTGIELEFDLPAGTSGEDRARVWQFPVRIRRPAQGSLQLLNRPELETRVTRWLEAAQLPRAACGRWYFTWNAFQIACDPDAVPVWLATVDLAAADLRDGASYTHPLAAAPGRLRQEAGTPGHGVFVTELAVDPEAVRRGEAESEAVAAEIMGNNPQLREAMAARATRQASRTIRVRFESDAATHLLRRTTLITLDIEKANGEHEHRTATETVERQLVPPHRS
jgi:hypothetical protein